jgi:hypothetical protein
MVARSSNRYFDIDTAELEALARAIGNGAEKIVKDEIRLGATRAVVHVKDEANKKINHRSGLMGRSWRWRGTWTGHSFVMAITNAAKSAAGFPYPVAVEFGRKAFSAIRAKALRFEIGGQVIFAKSVKAAPAQNILGNAATAASARVFAEFDAAKTRIATRIEGLR